MRRLIRGLALFHDRPVKRCEKVPDPFFLAFLLLAAPAMADDVFFQAGGSLRGLVVEEHDDRVVVSTEEGERDVFRRDIDEIFYAEPERNQLYLGNQALEEGDFAGASNFFQRALRMSPLLTEAQDALGRLEDLERKAGQPSAGDPAAALAGLGMKLRQDGEGWVVVDSVERGSEAQRWGLAAGDALVAHWGGSLRYLAPKQVAERVAGPSGSSLKLTLRRRIDLPPAQPPQVGWPGVKLEIEHFGITAREVEPTAPAFLAGLRPGDRIVDLGGASTRYMPLGAARKRVQQARERGIPLIIHRDFMITREGQTDG